ncbi:UDP-3-O-(3-hydroxymyristoyl)glucosamine N-acyltransferase [Roseovarius faecimaris]|uniref:UDP-3-O-(3-hydroxymyristoyl)glucosamine N-acyltransferase n=1 Tax=Roseovarius faecimaris TaxID=2494550 RepID=A0A6I6IRG3_9RHOB|nr:UDP-3-O-(3-hydroxymyristoyl)glucosamine N-acyltransferase [Roseovarius faecimaris]QGX98157.1 UDP-3-O-(3-hydroxymyristoyl)glucosamine N-acyltransferase [Roseovarius faecimaris]
MAHSVKEIAAALEAEAFGAVDIEVTGAAEPADAGATDLALAMKPAYAEALGQGQARAAMLWAGADWQALGLEAAILVPRPRYAMAGLTQMLDPGEGWEAGVVHPSAVIDPGAELGEGVTVGPLAVIARGARIGAGSVIGPQCFVGVGAEIGEGCTLREGARVAARVRLGRGVILQPGAVIGGDGFSYVTPEVSAIEKVRETLKDTGDAEAQAYARIHSLGSVWLQDGVEVGANTTIDRGTIRDTVIGARTKIDNLVQIGHNCITGTDCLICGMAGLAGSVTLGDNVVMGGRSAVADNTRIGSNVVLSGGTKVISNVPDGRVMMGYPATKMDTQIELYKYQRRLGRLFADVAALKKTVLKGGKSD